MLLKEFTKTKSVKKYHPNAWGYLLSLDCTKCDPRIITNKEKLIEFCNGLVREIKMVTHGPIVIDHFPNRDVSKRGFSFVQLIETSSITGHFVDETLSGYVDIFTCKEFNVDNALHYIQLHLNPEDIKINYTTREA